MLKGLKEATRGMKLVNLDHIAQMGRTAYRMGIEQRSNPHKDVRMYEVWNRGWVAERTAFEAMLRRNGADGVKLKLWMV